MQLHWFGIAGYKNIREPLRLDGLGRFNVLHGDNNVGKSNLLEGIGLGFLLLQVLREDVRGQVGISQVYDRRPPSEDSPPMGPHLFGTIRSFRFFEERDFPPDEIFHLHAPGPIEIRASVQLGAQDMEAADPAWQREPVEVHLRLERGVDQVAISLVNLTHADGAAVGTTEDETRRVAGRVVNLLARRRLLKDVQPRFALIRADRSIAGEALSVEAGSSAREPLSRELGLALYDAEGSSDVITRRRFLRLLAALGRFGDILGEGEWRTRFDRKTGRAELSFGAGTNWVPLRLMGSGIQQIVGLSARLVVTGADIVAIEEPELNLRFAAQLRLREILNDLTSPAGDGPSQIIVSSHSPAFETEEFFYALARTPTGPRVERRRRTEARLFTQPDLTTPEPGATAPLSYVTSDGLVVVPPAVREALGVEHGGGVMFVAGKDNRYRILSNDQFLEMLNPGEPVP